MTPPLRAVFLDIGDTVMRPNPSWEHVYAWPSRSTASRSRSRPCTARCAAPTTTAAGASRTASSRRQETSFRADGGDRPAAHRRAGLEPMPETFFRRLSELFMVTSHWHVFPDALPALDALRERGLVLGAVSNWVWQLPELLHALDLVAHFDFIAASARIGFEKPHPRDLPVGAGAGRRGARGGDPRRRPPRRRCRRARRRRASRRC